MEGALWKDLPDALIERVLTLVPAPRLLQMRAVSKEWSALILSRGFIDLCARMGAGSRDPAAPFFLFFTASGSSGAAVIAGFSPASGRWQSLSLDAMELGEVSVLASAGGLLCLGTGARIAACNPLTRSWRLLPEIPSCARLMPLLAALHIDPGGKGYKIVVGAPEGWSDQRTFVYDSESSAWERKGDLPNVLEIESDGVVCCGILFVACLIPRPRLLAFDLARGEWSKIQIPLPAGAVNPNLVICHDELHLVAAVENSIRIWKLLDPAKAMDQSWALVEEMPWEICCCFFAGGAGRDSFRCVGRASSIFVLGYDGEILCAVDLVSRAWRWLPNRKAAVEGRCCVDGFFVAEPALDIPI